MTEEAEGDKTMEEYCVQNKQNCSFNGVKSTSYDIYKVMEDRTNIKVGSGFARGHWASDAECISDYLEEQND